MSVENQTKAVVSVAEMARMLGLSRSRLYQLIGTAFPRPERQPETGRPIYTEEMQQVCLEVRRRNCGIDGKPILFYARRPNPTPTRTRSIKTPAPSPHAELLEGLRSLGLVKATAADVMASVRELYPQGMDGLDQGDVLRSIFLHLKRQNSGDKVR